MRTGVCVTLLVGSVLLGGCAERQSRESVDTMYAATGDMMAPGMGEPPPLLYSNTSLQGGVPYRDLSARGMPDEMANRHGEYMLDASFTPDEAVQLFAVGFRIPAVFRKGVNCKPGKIETIAPITDTAAPRELEAALMRANGQAAPGRSGPARLKPAKVAMSGRAADVVRAIEEAFDLEARWTGTQLEYTDVVTERFLLKTTNLKATFGSSSSSQSPRGESTSQQSGVSSQEINLWQELVKGVEQIAGPDACVSPVAGLGTVIVTAKPTVRNRVRAFVDPFNELIGQLVQIETTIIKVEINDNSTFGLNLDVLFQPSKNFSARLFGSTPSGGSTSGLSTFMLPPAAIGGTSHFAGSSLIQRLAAEQGRQSNVRNNKNYVTNGLPTRIELATTKRIVGNVPIGALSGGSDSVQTGAETEDVDFGFQLNLLPRVIGPNEIGLTMTLSDSSLSNERTRNVGQTSIDLFDRQRLETDNFVNLASGQTLVIAGLEQVIDRSDRQSNLFGFNRAGGSQKVRIILLITPTLVPQPGKAPA